MLTSDSLLVAASDENKEMLLDLFAGVGPSGSTNFEEVSSPAGFGRGKNDQTRIVRDLLRPAWIADHMHRHPATMYGFRGAAPKTQLKSRRKKTAAHRDRRGRKETAQ